MRALRRGRIWRWLQRAPEFSLPITTRHGRLYVRTHDKWLGQSLFLEGEFDYDKLPNALALSRHGRDGTLIDVGANIGTVCISGLREGWFERALAVEPAPTLYRLLRRNVRLNGLRERIITVQCALADRPGQADLELPSDNDYGDQRLRSNRPIGPPVMGESDRRTIRVATAFTDALLLP